MTDSAVDGLPTTFGRAAVLIGLRRTVRGRTPNILRSTGMAVGALLAVGSLVLGSGIASDRASTAVMLSIVYVVWTLGWMIGPIQMGGDDFLRPEWFAMLPGGRASLAVGVLLATCTGWGAVFTLGVTLSLVTFAWPLSLGAAVIAAPAALLLAITMILMSKVVAQLLGNAARAGIAVEVASLVYGLFIAGCLAGWVAFWGVLVRMSSITFTLASAVPEAVTETLRTLPTGWGLLAVDAAAAGQWWVVLSTLAGFAALDTVLFFAWSWLLTRRLERTSTTRQRRDVRGRAPRPSSSRVGAVVQRDVRSWLRDPRRGVEVRSTLWASTFTVFSIWLLVPDVLPFAGLVVALIGTMGATNIYAMDGTSLWLPLLCPGGERSDVLGRQLSWLVVFGSAAVVASVAAVVVTQAWWAIPVVLALLPAALGGGVGLIPMLGITLLVPEVDAHKRSSNPAETGAGSETFGLYWVMFIASSLTLAPPVAVLAWVLATGRAEWVWAAVPVGLVTGSLLAIGLGRIAIHQLQQHGPERLQRMRVGPATPSMGKTRRPSISPRRNTPLHMKLGT